MTYTAVYTFGDSLVDAGNILGLAGRYGNLVSDLEENAPTADRGYFQGRFSNGYTFADLIANKYLGTSTQPVFPSGFELLGFTTPFPAGAPANNLNFAYGGAEISGGSPLPDLDSQTDAYKAALHGPVNPSALHLFASGGNDVRELVPARSPIASDTTALTALQTAANALGRELGELIALGAKHIVVVGVPDVGIIPHYNGLSDEPARRAAATRFSRILDSMIQEEVARAAGANPSVGIRYIDFDAAIAEILPNLASLYGKASVYPPSHSELLFFDNVHPTAQAHALLAANFLGSLDPSGPPEEVLPDVDLAAAFTGRIDLRGENDTISFPMVGGRSYSLHLRGVSSGGGSLADPSLSIIAQSGLAVAQGDDSGLGLDAHIELRPSSSGTYTLNVEAVGRLTGTWSLEVASRPPVPEWRLFAGNGFVAEIAGDGNVIGTAGYQEIRVSDLPGFINFDPSFNRGGDVIRLAGNAGDWSVVGSGSSAILTDENTSVTLPVGATGVAIAFQDGARLLHFNPASEAFMIGEQTIGGVPATISAPAHLEVPPPDGTDGRGRLYLAAGAGLTIGVAGEVDVFGTAASEELRILSGEVQLDPSFNRGGDILIFDQAAAEFTARWVGSSIQLESDLASVLLPVGTTATLISFTDGEKPAYFDALLNTAFIGDQAIELAAASLSFA